jgi:hypothetical protein
MWSVAASQGKVFTMSNNLNFSTVLENQALKEVTINTAFGEMDAALTEQFSPALNAGNVALTATQFTKNIVFLVSGLTTAGRTLTVRNTRKVFFVRSDAANTQSFNVVLGTTSITVAAGTTALLYTDGTTNGLVSLASGAGGGGNPFSVPVVAPEFRAFDGATATQQIMLQMGWSDAAVRWALALEASRDLSLYGYGIAGGGSPVVTYTFTPAGQISSSLGTYWHSGNFGRPTSVGGAVGTVQMTTGTGSITLPSGGVYEYALSVERTSDGVLLSPRAQGLQARGVAPGGTSLGALGAGLLWILASWRIS